MPELHGSGDIFRADGNLGFDEGIVRGKTGGRVRLTFEGDFALCHGLDAQVSARAAAGIEAQLTALFLLKGMAQGEAFAAAGAGIEARMRVDLFDSFGFAASAAAFAEASVAGRLSVGLDLADAAAFAQTWLDNVAYDIFIAFLNEVSIMAGVWGQLSAAAMARAHINIEGSLKDDIDAGFVIEAGGAAGVAAGAGFDFYAGLKFENPKRFYLYAVERITREVVVGARAIAPPEIQPAIPLLELVLPTVLSAAYEIAQTTVIGALNSPEAMAASFVETFAAQMQRFLLDKLAECGGELLRGWLEGVLRGTVEGIAPRPLDSAEYDALKTTLDTALEEMRAGALDWETFEKVLPKILDCLSALFPDQAAEWRVPLTLLWTAITGADAVRRGVGAEFADGSVNFAGLSLVAEEAIILPLPDPPAPVREELEAFFGASPAHFTVTDATVYLVATGVAGATPFAIPELQTTLDLLARHTGITVGDLISGVLSGTLTRDVVHTEMYVKLRAFFKEALDGYLLADLLPALRRDLGPSADARIWIDEVAEPTLQMSSGFVFDRLDEFVNGTISGSDLSPALNSFRTALSHLVSKIVTRNVVVAGDILLNHAIKSLEQGFLDLETTIRRDPQGVVSLAAAQVATVLLPPLLPIPDTLPAAAQQLFADLANAGAATFGPRVFTEHHRVELRRLIIRLLDSIDGEVDYADGAALDNFFKGLFECAYVPDPDALVSLLDLQFSTLKDGLDVLLPRVLPALELFYLRLTKGVVDEMFDAAEQIVLEIANGIQSAWREFQRLQRAYEEFETAAVAAANDFANALQAAADILQSSARRAEIIDKLRRDGIATAAENAAPLGDLAVGIAVTAFTTAFDLAKPLIDTALKILGDVADDLGDIVEDAASLPELRDNLAAAVKEAVIKAIEDATGLDLPSEIGPSDVGEAAAAIIDGLRTLRNKLDELFDMRIARDLAEQARLTNEDERNRAQAAWETEQARLGDFVGTPVHISFIAPLPPAGDHPPVYGPSVQLILLIRGALPSYVEPGAIRRILVALNGQPLVGGRGEWQYNSDLHTLSFVTLLTAARHGLRPGLNVIECSVTDGANEIARTSASFAVNMASPLAADIQFDLYQSVINTLGNDHLRAEAECVVLNNFTQQPAALRGWSVRDAIGHHYVFGDVTMSPGARLTLHTGLGTDVTDGAMLRLFQGKNRAIWNNTGDTALLVDPSGVTRASLVYLPGWRFS